MTPLLRLSALCCAVLSGTVLKAQAVPKKPAPAKKAAAAAEAKMVEPTGPVVVIDTTQGRLSCRLYDRQAPKMTANFLGLATGTKDWKDGATGEIVHGRPFYDGNSIYGRTGAFGTGDRLGGGRGLAGEPFPEEKSGLTFGVPGRLAMEVKAGPNGRMTSSSVFFVTTYANDELTDRGEVFGQCDPPSIQLARQIAHGLLLTDNHPAILTGINHIAVWNEGAPAPPIVANIPSEQLVPQFGPAPVPLIPPPAPTGPKVVIDTILGPLKCQLFNETPIATQNFLGLAEGTKDWKNPVTHATVHGKPFYNGLTFGRLIPDFMIQQSDVPGGEGDGDIGIQFGVEQVPGLLFDQPGRLAYANSGPNTNASEFFITETPNARLDGNFTIFGQCDKDTVKLVGMIARVPRDAHNRPLKPIPIKSVQVTR